MNGVSFVLGWIVPRSMAENPTKSEEGPVSVVQELVCAARTKSDQDRSGRREPKPAPTKGD